MKTIKVPPIIKVSPKMGYWSLKEYYDEGNSAFDSPILYTFVVKELTEYLLDRLYEYEAEKSVVYAEINALNLPNECNFNSNVKAREEIECVRQQAISMRDELMTITDLNKLAEFEDPPLPSFRLVAEVLVEKLRFTAMDVEFYEQHTEFVRNVAAFCRNNTSGNESVFKLFDYVRAGHLLRKHGRNSTVADYILEQLANFRNKHATPCDSAYEIEQFRANLRDVLSKLKDTGEKRWLENWINSIE